MVNIIKNLAVLGSTGSIGQQTLEIVRAFPNRFRVIALAAGRNYDLLARQINEFKPEFIYLQNEKARPHLDNGCEFLTLEEIARHPEVDTVVIATSGTSGLLPVLSAVKAGKSVALANKESLVMAGELITKEARLNNARILPVDSEHSAIWQCLAGEEQKAARIILTASGGPFRELPPEKLEKVTVEQALKHPSWQMGPKVTIDSATLMNKGLEIIEARWLFDMPIDTIKVIIHPQSIIHSMVEFADGSVKAQLSPPDMRLPIQYALAYPERLPNHELPRINWDSLRNLTFEPPDPDRFPALKLAVEAGMKGNTYPAVLASADEAAVELFLARKIKFTDITRLVAEAFKRHEPPTHSPSLEEIIAAAAWAKETVLNLAGEDSPL